MHRIHSHIRNAIEAFKAGDTGSCLSAMECAVELVEEKFKSTNSASQKCLCDSCDYFKRDGCGLYNPGVVTCHSYVKRNGTSGGVA